MILLAEAGRAVIGRLRDASRAVIGRRRDVSRAVIGDESNVYVINPTGTELAAAHFYTLSMAPLRDGLSLPPLSGPGGVCRETAREAVGEAMGGHGSFFTEDVSRGAGKYHRGSVFRL